MKKAFLIVFSLWSLFSFAQQVNEYEFVIIPTKFDFQKSENEHRLNTILKFRLDEYGFKTFYSSEQLNTNYADRCIYLTADVVNESSMFLTKLYIVFKDCNNTIIFQSEVGSSKVKERREASKDALEMALLSVKKLNYKFESKKNKSVTKVSSAEISNATEKTQALKADSLFAQPITNGFQLVDDTPKVVLKIFKTSEADLYIANGNLKNGIVIKQNNEWIFQYYSNEKLISEKLNIKF